MNPIVSVIVPIYNSDKYLRRTLNSIICQTYKNWECILVDDGSTDLSSMICDDYVLRDSRFSVVHKSNQGVGSARNCGIDYAKGDYIVFFDSDDLMKSSCLETCLSKIGDADLLLFSFERWNGRTDQMILNDVFFLDPIACENYLYSLKENGKTSEFFCFPWNKFYKRSILTKEKIRFPEDISLREDEIFNYRYLPFVRRAKAISDVLIAYNDEPSGLSAKKISSSHSFRLAGYLLNQMQFAPNDVSKTILYQRAMVYLIDSIINSSSIIKKVKIADFIIKEYKFKSFTLSSHVQIGKYYDNVISFCEKKSVLGILYIALRTHIDTWVGVHIKHDEGLIRWGTNL